MKTSTTGGFVAILCVIISLSCACRGKGNQKSSQENKIEKTVITQYGYTVKNVYPHDPTAYTQGLYWYDGYLWESTGLQGESQMRKVELETGKVLMATDLTDDFFGEGAAYLDGKIYQLTWKNGIAFVYEPATLQKIGQFRYPGQGWGLTTDGKVLYMSDGSSKIFVVDPEDFTRMKSIDVKAGRANRREINELEWIDGKIWANVYTSDAIIIIDPESGQVEGIINLEGILAPEDRTYTTEVMNGIAFDPVNRRIFVTGKNWSKLFEIEIYEK